MPLIADRVLNSNKNSLRNNKKMKCRSFINHHLDPAILSDCNSLHKYKLTLLIFAILMSLSSSKLKEDWLTFKAKQGDGIKKILSRYHLDHSFCNEEKFLILNNLSPNSNLLLDKTYQLPILTIPFDGKSIRSTLGITAFDKAKEIESYNIKMHQAGLRDKAFQDDKKLWVPYHALNCNVPIPSNEKVFPIFGKYESTPILSDILKGKIFYIISGHGGPDPGAQGVKNGNTLCEDEYAYDVGLRLCRKLIQEGAMSYMITRDGNDGIRDDEFLQCDKDETVWGGEKIPLGQRERLEQRIEIVKSLFEKNKSIAPNGQFLMEIHVDSRHSDQQVDLFLYHQVDNQISHQTANKIYQTFGEKYRQYRSNGIYKGTLSSRELYSLKNAPMPAVYIELGNLRNTFDQQRFILPENRQALANWLFEGLK
jgi:N-acetylmuramoyl-L-alanine amidase